MLRPAYQAGEESVFVHTFAQTFRSNLRRRIKLAVGPAILLLLSGVTAPVTSAEAGGHGYDSIPHNLPGNLVSLGFEATQTSEFGNQITFAGPSRSHNFGHVEVTMSSWGCQAGSWFANNCTTQPGSTFTVPITLNIYNPPASGGFVPGSPITSVTQIFAIPYRPSLDAVNCSGGRWYDRSSKTCFNGLATNITFDIDRSVDLPSTIVFGIAYNTSHAGYVPQGATACSASSGGCGYDSLNVAVSEDPTDVSAGSNPNPGTVFWNTWTPGPAPAGYCDSGAKGLGVFRLDSPGSGNGCWSYGAPGTLPAYVPAVRFKG